ncbi:unnamed protein product [Ectocarpus sp. CCAP 1310/34]|nr:unnamed protein product [Ectocarpus sp. CCAP 1310/34]
MAGEGEKERLERPPLQVVQHSGLGLPCLGQRITGVRNRNMCSAKARIFAPAAPGRIRLWPTEEDEMLVLRE